MRDWIVLCSFLVVACSLKDLSEDLSQNSALQQNKLNLIHALHRQANYDDKGIWKKHVEWKARWVKEWHERKILVPFWRKVWGPIEISEWVPLPKLPPWNPYEQKNENVM